MFQPYNSSPKRFLHDLIISFSVVLFVKLCSTTLYGNNHVSSWLPTKYIYKKCFQDVAISNQLLNNILTTWIQSKKLLVHHLPLLIFFIFSSLLQTKKKHKMDCSVCTTMPSILRPPRNTICGSCYDGARTIISLLKKLEDSNEDQDHVKLTDKSTVNVGSSLSSSPLFSREVASYTYSHVCFKKLSKFVYIKILSICRFYMLYSSCNHYKRWSNGWKIWKKLKRNRRRE